MGLCRASGGPVGVAPFQGSPPADFLGSMARENLINTEEYVTGAILLPHVAAEFQLSDYVPLCGVHHYTMINKVRLACQHSALSLTFDIVYNLTTLLSMIYVLLIVTMTRE